MSAMQSKLGYETRRKRRLAVAVAVLCMSLAAAFISVALIGAGAWAQSVRPPATAVQPWDQAEQPGSGEVPGQAQGSASDSELWRQVRRGEGFNSSARNTDADSLILSTGEEWRSVKNGPLSQIGVYTLGGMFAVLVLFFILRGRIRIEHGPSGETIQRFNNLERFGHWLLAVSFIILAITGLNVSYGRYLLLDTGLMSAELFSQISIAGKWIHNHCAFAFIAGLVLVFVMWVLRNIPSFTDIKWLLKGGGLFVKGVHPDSWKFNAGQKLIFWSTVLGGASLSLSGVALMFPTEFQMMAKTFIVLNDLFALNLPTELSLREEMQLQTTWHTFVAFVMIAIIVAHIYIGSLGMEGAFDAMGSGRVDLNWAKEHHNLWVEEVTQERGGRGAGSGESPSATPAE